MQWESLGFSENLFSTDPISQNTLDLYTGHQSQIQICQNVIKEKNIVLVIEGSRGVGTTSFANYLRFSAQKEKEYFTPSNEVRIEPGWTLETLLAVIIGNITREIELFHSDKIKRDKRFQESKALSARISETYRSFGIEAFGFGMNYEKTPGTSSQPIVVPSSVLGHHLEDLAALVKSLGYPFGILLQLNNLDVGSIHEEKHLKYLFNAMRDYIQTDGLSWFLVGDVGLRHFIAKEVDRLDDIISFEVQIASLEINEYENLIQKRTHFYRSNPKAEVPIDKEVFLYLYQITKGRLRYIFGLLTRLMNYLSVGDLTDRLTLNIVKPMVLKLARDQVAMNSLTPGEEHILKTIVFMQSGTVSEISKKTEKSLQYTSNLIKSLTQKKLMIPLKVGKNRLYTPVLDAMIAYAE